MIRAASIIYYYYCAAVGIWKMFHVRCQTSLMKWMLMFAKAKLAFDVYCHLSYIMFNVQYIISGISEYELLINDWACLLHNFYKSWFPFSSFGSLIILFRIQIHTAEEKKSKKNSIWRPKALLIFPYWYTYVWYDDRHYMFQTMSFPIAL